MAYCNISNLDHEQAKLGTGYALVDFHFLPLDTKTGGNHPDGVGAERDIRNLKDPLAIGISPQPKLQEFHESSRSWCSLGAYHAARYFARRACPLVSTNTICLFRECSLEAAGLPRLTRPDILRVALVSLPALDTICLFGECSTKVPVCPDITYKPARGADGEGGSSFH